MNLLSEEDKQNIHKIFDNLHDTFSRDIEIYVSERETIVNLNPEFNPIFGEKDKNSPFVAHTKYVRKARIKYIGDQERVYGIGLNSQLNVSFAKGEIRLKVDDETYKLIAKAKKINIDGNICELISSPIRIGPFNPNYWMIQVKQSE